MRRARLKWAFFLCWRTRCSITLHESVRLGRGRIASVTYTRSYSRAPTPRTILRTRMVQIIDLPRQSFGRQILVERGVHKPI